MLTMAKTGAVAARIGETACGRTEVLRRRFFASSRTKTEVRRGGNGEGEVLGRAGSPLLSERGGEERSGERTWEWGRCGFGAERRERAGGWRRC